MSKKSSTTTKSTGRKSAAKKSTPAAKKSAAKKTGGTPAVKKSASAPKTTPTTTVASSSPAVRRFEHLAETAKTATELMRKSAKSGSTRGPVTTPNIVAVVDALKSQKTTPTKLTGLTGAELTKLATGAAVPKKSAEKFASAKSAARTFSSDTIGRASTKNKLRGAKLYAILAVIEADKLMADRQTTAAVAQRRAVAVK